MTISSFDASQFREIQDVQEWVARNYDISAHVRQSMDYYLSLLREQFDLTPDEASRP